MTNAIVVLSGEQRDQIMKALKAIERQVQKVVTESDWQALYVIGTNLAIIQTNLTNLPKTSSN